MLHGDVQIWGCHICACRELESGSDECVKSEAVGIRQWNILIIAVCFIR